MINGRLKSFRKNKIKKKTERKIEKKTDKNEIETDRCG